VDEDGTSTAACGRGGAARSNCRLAAAPASARTGGKKPPPPPYTSRDAPARCAAPRPGACTGSAQAAPVPAGHAGPKSWTMDAGKNAPMSGSRLDAGGRAGAGNDKNGLNTGDGAENALEGPNHAAPPARPGCQPGGPIASTAIGDPMADPCTTGLPGAAPGTTCELYGASSGTTGEPYGASGTGDVESDSS